jgi:RND family efflux transporter MFP subunit
MFAFRLSPRAAVAFLIFAPLLVLTGAIAACGGRPAASPASAADPKAPRSVKTIAAVEKQLERLIAVTGTLAAEEQVTVSFKVTGRLDSLDVDLGSSVAKGQSIGKLVPTDFQLRVTQAEAALQQARARLGLTADGDDDAIDVSKASLVRQAQAVLDQSRLTRDRAASFAKQGIGSQADLDAAEANYRVSEGRYQDAIEEVRNRQGILAQRRTELELAKQALSDSRLTAPFAGRVRERQATPGQFLATGAPVVTIVKIHPLRLRVSIPERESSSVRVGQLVRVTVEGDVTVHQGRVSRISPAIEENSRTLSVEAEVANVAGLLRPGAFANAEVVTEASDMAILIPGSAIVSFAGVEKVFVVKDGKAVERRVTTGRRATNQIEVLKGLTVGENVIVAPGNLVDGAAVAATPGGGLP